MKRLLTVILLLAAPAFATLPAVDNFQRGTGLGANWTSLAGSWTTNAGGFATPPGTNSLVYWSADAFANDQYACITVGPNGLTYIGPGVRFQAGAVSGYTLTIGTSGVTSSGDLYVDKWTAGAQVHLLSAVGPKIYPGDMACLQVTGTLLTAIVNGNPVISTTDATYASGSAGMWGITSSSSPKVSRFVAGNVATPSAPASLPAPYVTCDLQTTLCGMGTFTSTGTESVTPGSTPFAGCTTIPSGITANPTTAALISVGTASKSANILIDSTHPAGVGIPTNPALDTDFWLSFYFCVEQNTLDAVNGAGKQIKISFFRQTLNNDCTATKGYNMLGFGGGFVSSTTFSTIYDCGNNFPASNYNLYACGTSCSNRSYGGAMAAGKWMGIKIHYSGHSAKSCGDHQIYFQEDVTTGNLNLHSAVYCAAQMGWYESNDPGSIMFGIAYTQNLVGVSPWRMMISNVCSASYDTKYIAGCL